MSFGEKTLSFILNEVCNIWKLIIYSESKRMTITSAHFTTISGHCSVNCMFSFHKKEVQTVILRCLMALNIGVNWGLECAWLTFKIQQLINEHFTSISGHFFANTMLIFHKNEILMVVLRCLRSLNRYWYNSYDKKQKTQKTQKSVFVVNHKKTKMEIFAFCVTIFEPIRF